MNHVIAEAPGEGGSHSDGLIAHDRKLDGSLEFRPTEYGTGKVGLGTDQSVSKGSRLSRVYVDAPNEIPTANNACARPDARTLAAIVPVATDHGSHASGIVVDINRVLTAAHALQGAGHFFVRLNGTFRRADLLMVDHKADLAILAINTQRIMPLSVSGFEPSLSELVWAAGYPRAEEITLSRGVLEQLVGGTLHASASIDSGQSGGGLLSCFHGNWSLVGMLRGFGAYQQGDQFVKLENHSVSVAGSTITEFLRSYY